MEYNGLTNMYNLPKVNLKKWLFAGIYVPIMIFGGIISVKKFGHTEKKIKVARATYGCEIVLYGCIKI